VNDEAYHLSFRQGGRAAWRQSAAAMKNTLPPANRGAEFLPVARVTGDRLAFHIADIANDLDVPVKWLNSWLLRHPCDDEGYPLYRRMGRTKLFTKDDFRRIKQTMKKKIVERPLAEEGVVYFVASGDFIKIGFSRSMKSRMQKFFTESPLPAILLHNEPGTFKTEKSLHRQFGHLRAKGEWFRKTQELLDYIEERKRLLTDQEQAP
jgi:hypothetical protein